MYWWEKWLLREDFLAPLKGFSLWLPWWCSLDSTNQVIYSACFLFSFYLHLVRPSWQTLLVTCRKTWQPSWLVDSHYSPRDLSAFLTCQPSWLVILHDLSAFVTAEEPWRTFWQPLWQFSWLVGSCERLMTRISIRDLSALMTVSCWHWWGGNILERSQGHPIFYITDTSNS